MVVTAEYLKGAMMASTPLIIQSRSLNPHVNLALEKWIFEQGNPDQPCALLWRNQRCLVIGRNQNPWLECAQAMRNNEQLVEGVDEEDANLCTQALPRAHTPIIRRHSGGGTVYHDPGTLLWTFMMPRKAFCRQKYAEMIASLFPAAIVGERHDIWQSGRKIGGSAFRIQRERAYHHGTLLLDCDLRSLQLHCMSVDPTEHTDDNNPNREKSEGSAGICKSAIVNALGTPSVRSPVSNLRPSQTHWSVTQKLIKKYSEMHGPTTTKVISMDPETASPSLLALLKEEIDVLRGWEWTFGRTPRFSVDLGRGVGVEEIVDGRRRRGKGERFQFISKKHQENGQWL